MNGANTRLTSNCMAYASSVELQHERKFKLVLQEAILLPTCHRVKEREHSLNSCR